MLACCGVVGNFFSCQENRQAAASQAKTAGAGSGGFRNCLQVEVNPSPSAAPAPPAPTSPARPEIKAPSAPAPSSPTASSAAPSPGVRGGGRCGQCQCGNACEAKPVSSDGSEAVDHEHGHDGARCDHAAPQTPQQRHDALPHCLCHAQDRFSHPFALRIPGVFFRLHYRSKRRTCQDNYATTWTEEGRWRKTISIFSA